MQLIFFLPIQAVLAVYCFRRTNLSLAVIEFSRAVGDEILLQAARTAASCLGSRSLCFLPGLVPSQNTHHLFVIIWAFMMLGCFQRDIEKDWRRERRRNGGEEEKFLKGVHAPGFQVPLSKDLCEESVGSAFPRAAVKGEDLSLGSGLSYAQHVPHAVLLLQSSLSGLDGAALCQVQQTD